MKKVIFMAALAVGVLSSCSQNELDTEISNSSATQKEGELKISTSILSGSESRAGFVAKTNFATGDEMGIFLYKSTGWGDAYPEYSSQNNKSTKTASGWSLANEIYLLQEKAYIWAYYPYNQSVTDGTKIPVPISTTSHVDYLWGKSTNTPSVVETEAIIPMKHALSQFVIRLKVSPEYHNEGNLTSAKLKSTQAKFATNGTMNVNDNGKITFSPTTTELTWAPNTTVPVQGEQAVDFSAAIYPMTISSNEVTLEVVIDGATYTYVIPQIEWTAGKRFIYSITMRSNSIEIGGENGQSVTIEDWSSTESDVTLVPVK
jgi:hypothetical protein